MAIPPIVKSSIKKELETIARKSGREINENQISAMAKRHFPREKDAWRMMETLADEVNAEMAPIRYALNTILSRGKALMTSDGVMPARKEKMLGGGTIEYTTRKFMNSTPAMKNKGLPMKKTVEEGRPLRMGAWGEGFHADAIPQSIRGNPTGKWTLVGTIPKEFANSVFASKEEALKALKKK